MKIISYFLSLNFIIFFIALGGMEKEAPLSNFKKGRKKRNKSLITSSTTLIPILPKPDNYKLTMLVEAIEQENPNTTNSQETIPVTEDFSAQGSYQPIEKNIITISPSISPNFTSSINENKTTCVELSTYSKNQNKFKCGIPYCYFSSRSPHSVISHLQNAHPSQSIFYCTQAACPRIFGSQEFLDEHMQNDHGQSSFGIIAPYIISIAQQNLQQVASTIALTNSAGTISAISDSDQLSDNKRKKIEDYKQQDKKQKPNN